MVISHKIISALPYNNKTWLFISQSHMSSTTTSSSTESSSEDDSTEPQQGQDEEVLKNPKHILKRKRKPENWEGSASNDDTTKQPPKKKRKLRRLEIAQPTGWILHVTGISRDVIEGIQKEFKDPLTTKLFPDVQSEIIDVKYLKRLPTEKEKQDWDAETKRLSREKRKAEGKGRKELTDEEKEARRLKNLDPVFIERKRTRAGIKKKVFDANAENKALYLKMCEEALGKVVRKRTPRKKKEVTKKEEEAKKEETKMDEDPVEVEVAK